MESQEGSSRVLATRSMCDDTSRLVAASTDVPVPAPSRLREGSAFPRILHLIGSLERGGTETQLVEFIRRSSDPFRHTVAVFDCTGPLAEELEVPPVLVGPLRRGFRDLEGNLRAARQLHDLIRDERIELVHAHLSMSELLAALSVPFGVPIVASRRGRTFEHEDRRWFRIAQRVAHRRVRLMLCNTEELARFTLSHDGSPPPVLVIPNGVDVDPSGPPPLPGEPVVAVVANLIWYKRHDLFLRAFADVRRVIPDAHAVLVGDGPERPRLLQLRAELSLERAVSFAGQTDPRPFVAAARVVTLTSVHEGLPNALLEAMAMGRPVVATAVGGIPEIVTDGVEGWILAADPEALAGRICQLLSPDGPAEEMGRAARLRAESFAWERMVRATEHAYRRVLAREPLVRGQRVI